MSNQGTRVRFERTGAGLTAVSIVRGGRSPVIARLHGALIAIGIVVSSYQVRAEADELRERFVLEASDGGGLDDDLSEETQATILLIAST